MNEGTKLKPVTFLRGDYGYTRNNNFQQQLLLKAMQVSMDPKFLMKSAGLKNLAELQRTLDKISIRKEYHSALIENNLDLDFIVKGFKNLCFSESDVVKLGSLKALLKSLGLEDYKETEGGGQNSWEDMVNAVSEMEKTGEVVAELHDYKVEVPQIPESERKKREEEREIGIELYEE
jgi:hypothetical protein